MGFFSSTKDLNVYPMQRDLRRDLAEREAAQQRGLYETDPHNFWEAPSFQEWGESSGLGSAMPGGGLTWENMIGAGGPGGGGGGWGGGGGAVGYGATGYAAKAGQVDTSLEPFDTEMDEAIRQGFVGRLRAGQGAERDQYIREMTARAGLSGLSPAAQEYQAQQAAQGSADVVGNETQKFEEAAYRAALERWAQALGINANLLTSASIATAGNRTNASIASAGNRTSASAANAGYSSMAANAAADREAQAAAMMTGLYARERTPEWRLAPYQELNRRYMGYQTPVGQKTQTPGWGTQLIGMAAPIVGAIAGALGSPRPGNSGDTGGQAGPVGPDPYSFTNIMGRR